MSSFLLSHRLNPFSHISLTLHSVQDQSRRPEKGLIPSGTELPIDIYLFKAQDLGTTSRGEVHHLLSSCHLTVSAQLLEAYQSWTFHPPGCPPVESQRVIRNTTSHLSVQGLRIS